MIRHRPLPQQGCAGVLRFVLLVVAWWSTWLVTAVHGDMWFTSYSSDHGGGCNKSSGGGEASAAVTTTTSSSSTAASNNNSTSSSTTSSSTSSSSSSTDAKTIVTQVFLILAVGVAMSTLLLLFTYLQLRYCKNCGRSGVGPSSGEQGGSGSRGGGGGGRRQARAVDTSLAAQANLTGMSKQERRDVLEHLFRPCLVGGAGNSLHSHSDYDVEKGAATSPASHHTASRQSESFHNTNDRVWESDEPSKDFCCSICLSALAGTKSGGPILVTPCQHRFHYKCCREWLQTRDTCPYCRTDLLTVEQLRSAALEVLGKGRLEELGADPDDVLKVAETGTAVVVAASATESASAASATTETRGDESR